MNNTSPELLYGLSICHQVQDATVDIVFVHGLTGDRQSTWTHKPSGTFWPRDLLIQVIPRSRILAFGYDADYGHVWTPVSSNCVRNHARNFIKELVTMRMRSGTTGRPILFVAHSLGGIVVADTLVRSRNHVETNMQDVFLSCKGVAFLGTPHRGSDLARWSFLLQALNVPLKDLNPDIVAVLRPESEVLAGIQSEFQSILRVWRDENGRAINVVCFYEELGIKNSSKLIVPKHSAVLPAYEHLGIHADHVSMTKFERADDPGFKAVAGYLSAWVAEMVGSRGEPYAVRAPGRFSQ